MKLTRDKILILFGSYGIVSAATMAWVAPSHSVTLTMTEKQNIEFRMQEIDAYGRESNDRMKLLLSEKNEILGELKETDWRNNQDGRTKALARMELITAEIQQINHQLAVDAGMLPIYAKQLDEREAELKKLRASGREWIMALAGAGCIVVGVMIRRWKSQRRLSESSLLTSDISHQTSDI